MHISVPFEKNETIISEKSEKRSKIEKRSGIS
jgi:hypothetical protein